MFKGRFKSVCFIQALALALALNLTAFAQCLAAKDQKQSALTLHGGISALAGACAGAGITIEASTLPTSITKVRMGSPAAYAGVCDGDQLLKGSLGANTMQLLIERGGKRYGINLRYTPDNLVQQKQTKNSPAKRRLAAQATQDQDWKKLKQYDITLLVDSSGSMQESLPDSGADSKWQWCVDEIFSLAQEAQRLGSGHFDLCTFSDSHQMTPNCTAEQARTVLNNVRPGGGTDLGTPVQEILDDHTGDKSQKPFLLVIVTDGMPRMGKKVEDVIIEAAKRVKSNQQVKILFLQIGNDTSGKVLADYLDNDLVQEGAPYDLVSSIESDQLVDLGLRRGLIAALNKAENQSQKSNPQLDAELAKVRAELARLRAQKTGQSK